MNINNLRHQIFKPLLRFISRAGGIDLLSFSHREQDIMNSHITTNGEKKVIAQLAALNSTPVIFDVGANIGEYSSLIKQIIPAASLHAFEPNPPTFEVLAQRGLDARLNNFALGSESGSMELHVPDKTTSGHATIVAEALEGRSILKTETISVSTLAEYCASQAVTAIDFLKIDTEGYELEVLKGAGKLLNNIHVIQFEMNYHFIHKRIFLKDFYNLLPEHFFFRITHKGLIPLGPHDPKNEIFRMHNLLAVHKAEVEYWRRFGKW